MIQELEFARGKEKNRKYPTFDINYYNLLGDVINKINELLNKNAELEQSKKLLEAIELAFHKGEEVVKDNVNWFIEKTVYEPTNSCLGGRFAHINHIPIMDWYNDQKEGK